MTILKTKPKHHIEIGNGAFIADFYVDEKNPDVKHNYLHIYTPNGVFEQRVVGYPFGYLLAAVSHGNEEELRNFCVLQWRITQEIYQDAGLANDILHAFAKRDKRLMKQAERNAAKVTDEQGMADTELMRETIAYAEASPKERKRMSKESREEMKKALNEDEE